MTKIHSEESLIPYLQKEKAKLARISVDQAERIRLLEAETLALRTCTHRLEFERDSYMTEWYSLAKDLVDRSTDFEHWELVKGVANARRRLHKTKQIFVNFIVNFVKNKISAHFTQITASLLLQTSTRLTLSRYLTAWHRQSLATTQQLKAVAMRRLADRRRKRQAFHVWAVNFRAGLQLCKALGGKDRKFLIHKYFFLWRAKFARNYFRSRIFLSKIFTSWRGVAAQTAADINAASFARSRCSLARNFRFWSFLLRSDQKNQEISDLQSQGASLRRGFGVWRVEVGKRQNKRKAVLCLGAAVSRGLGRLSYAFVHAINEAQAVDAVRATLVRVGRHFQLWRAKTTRRRRLRVLERLLSGRSEDGDESARTSFAAWRATATSRFRVVFRPESTGKLFAAWRRETATRAEAAAKLGALLTTAVKANFGLWRSKLAKKSGRHAEAVATAVAMGRRREVETTRRLWLTRWRSLCAEQRLLDALKRKFQESVDHKLARSVLKELRPVKKAFSLQALDQLAETLVRRYEQPHLLRRLLRLWRGSTVRERVHLRASDAIQGRRQRNLQTRILELLSRESARSSEEISAFSSQADSPPCEVEGPQIPALAPIVAPPLSDAETRSLPIPFEALAAAPVSAAVISRGSSTRDQAAQTHHGTLQAGDPFHQQIGALTYAAHLSPPGSVAGHHHTLTAAADSHASGNPRAARSGGALADAGAPASPSADHEAAPGPAPAAPDAALSAPTDSFSPAYPPVDSAAAASPSPAGTSRFISADTLVPTSPPAREARVRTRSTLRHVEDPAETLTSGSPKYKEFALTPSPAPVSASAAVAATATASVAIAHTALASTESPPVAPASRVPGTVRMLFGLASPMRALFRSVFAGFRSRVPAQVPGVIGLVDSLRKMQQRRQRQIIASLVSKPQFPFTSLVEVAEKAGARSAISLARVFRNWRRRGEKLRSLERVADAAGRRSIQEALAQLRRHSGSARMQAVRAEFVDTLIMRAERRMMKMVLVLWRSNSRNFRVSGARLVASAIDRGLRRLEVFPTLRAAREDAVLGEREELMSRFLEKKDKRVMLVGWRAATAVTESVRLRVEEKRRNVILRSGFASFADGLRRTKATRKLASALARKMRRVLDDLRNQLASLAGAAVNDAVLYLSDKRVQAEAMKRILATWRLVFSETKQRREREILVAAARELELLRDEVQKAARRAGLLIN